MIDQHQQPLGRRRTSTAAAAANGADARLPRADPLDATTPPGFSRCGGRRRATAVRSACSVRST
jgi:hypothetical protein